MIPLNNNFRKYKMQRSRKKRKTCPLKTQHNGKDLKKTQRDEKMFRVHGLEDVV